MATTTTTDAQASSTTLDVDTLRRHVDLLDGTGQTEVLSQIARDALDEVVVLRSQVATLQQHHVDLWRLLGRCEYAFALLSKADSLPAVREVAEQLHAEIRKAAGV